MIVRLNLCTLPEHKSESGETGYNRQGETVATCQAALWARGWDVRPYMLCAFSHALYVWKSADTARYTSVFLHTLVAFCILHRFSFHFVPSFPSTSAGCDDAQPLHVVCYLSQDSSHTILPLSSVSETTTLTPPHVLKDMYCLIFHTLSIPAHFHWNTVYILGDLDHILWT